MSGKNSPKTTNFSLFPNQIQFVCDRAKALYKMPKGARSSFLRHLIDREIERVRKQNLKSKKPSTSNHSDHG